MKVRKYIKQISIIFMESILFAFLFSVLFDYLGISAQDSFITNFLSGYACYQIIINVFLKTKSDIYVDAYNALKYCANRLLLANSISEDVFFTEFEKIKTVFEEKNSSMFLTKDVEDMYAVLFKASEQKHIATIKEIILESEHLISISSFEWNFSLILSFFK